MTPEEVANLTNENMQKLVEAMKRNDHRTVDKTLPLLTDIEEGARRYNSPDPNIPADIAEQYLKERGEKAAQLANDGSLNAFGAVSSYNEAKNAIKFIGTEPISPLATPNTPKQANGSPLPSH